MDLRMQIADKQDGNVRTSSRWWPGASRLQWGWNWRPFPQIRTRRLYKPMKRCKDDSELDADTAFPWRKLSYFSGYNLFWAIQITNCSVSLQSVTNFSNCPTVFFWRATIRRKRSPDNKFIQSDTLLNSDTIDDFLSSLSTCVAKGLTSKSFASSTNSTHDSTTPAFVWMTIVVLTTHQNPSPW